MIKALLAVLAVTLAFPSFADVKMSPKADAAVITFDAETMTTNVEFSTNIDTTYFPVLTCEVSVTAGNTRSVIPKCYAESTYTTLTFTYPTMTVAASAQGRYVFDPRTSAATADTGVTDSPNSPCRFIQITAAAAGPGTVSCTLRRY